MQLLKGWKLVLGYEREGGGGTFVAHHNPG